MKNTKVFDHPARVGPSGKGFALVVTVSLMVLLSVIAIGFLNLSAVSMRSGSQEQAKMEARANARLALQVAIGELQKQLGPDQRISANGDITSTGSVLHPHWTGVWDSWVAGDPAHATVNSNYPSGTSHQQTIGSQPDASMRPDYLQKNKHFRAWLLSLDPQETTDPSAPTKVALTGVAMPDEKEDAVRLVGPGSLGHPPIHRRHHQHSSRRHAHGIRRQRHRPGQHRLERSHPEF